MRKTYRQWQEEGYHVRKGEKSVGKSNRGEALFDREQVEFDADNDYDWDEDDYPRDTDYFEYDQGFTW